MQNPVRGFLHGAAAVASAAGLTLLVLRANGGGRLLAALVFGMSLLGMYVVSALYHSFPWSETVKERMQRLDHVMIFLLIAGTWTPIASIVLEGVWRVVMLAAVWATALVGVVLKLVLPRSQTWLSVSLQTAMGWGALIALPELLRRLETSAVVLVVAGGICYTLGMIMFALRKPRLFPLVFSYHEAFHVLVVAGSVFHFWLIFHYVLPYAG